MKWNPFQHNGNTYDLSHLHPFGLELINPARDDKPEQVFRFDVRFSLHCFTKEQKENDDQILEYSDNREARTFCFDRYRLSIQLPDIIQNIHTKYCRHTGWGNFFIVELINDAGVPTEYEIYFDVNRPKQHKGSLELFIQSAYVRDEKRVSDLLCICDLVHASNLKEHDNNDNFQGITRRAA